MILPHERTERPLGSEQELTAMGVSLNDYGCCAQREKGIGGKKGCPFYEKCEFKDLKNASGGPPPLNLAVYLYKSFEQTSNTVQVDCYGYYAGGFKAMKDNAHKTGNVVKIVALEGDGRKFKTRITRPLHRIPDRTNCPDCARGDCRKRVTEYEERTVAPFERPTATLAIMAESQRVKDLPEIDLKKVKSEQEKEEVLDMGTKRRG